jgi:hypothetical protein
MQLTEHLAGILAIGAAFGLLSTVGIYFDSRVGGKFQVICAGTIRGLLVALLVASTTPASGGWLTAAGLGALYGAVVALMITLSHGADARRHSIYIIPPSVVSGALIGALIGHLWG